MANLSVSIPTSVLTYFARHTEQLAIDDEWIDRLWAERRIAVHYPEQRDGRCTDADNDSLDPRDHHRFGAQVMRALNELATNGGYACAQYRGREACLLGRVEPGTSIEPLQATWRREHYPTGRPAALKTIRLKAVREVAPEDHALLLVGRPLRGTFTRWRKAGDTIASLVEGRPLPFSLDRLSPRQQEVLCSEFLRLPEAAAMGLPTLQHLLLPTGRTMKDLDVVGMAIDGRRIFAQVTLEPFGSADWKAERLRTYAGPSDPHLILFCRVTATLHDGPVRVCPIDEAYKRFVSSPGGAAWMAAAVGATGDAPGR